MTSAVKGIMLPSLPPLPLLGTLPCMTLPQSPPQLPSLLLLQLPALLPLRPLLLPPLISPLLPLFGTLSGRIRTLPPSLILTLPALPRLPEMLL